MPNESVSTNIDVTSSFERQTDSAREVLDEIRLTSSPFRQVDYLLSISTTLDILVHANRVYAISLGTNVELSELSKPTITLLTSIALSQSIVVALNNLQIDPTPTDPSEGVNSQNVSLGLQVTFSALKSFGRSDETSLSLSQSGYAIHKTDNELKGVVLIA